MPYKNIENRRQCSKRHYRAHSDVYKIRAKIHTKAVKRTIRTYLAQYLQTHPCIDCGEYDPIVLEFDHINPEQKEFNIADGLSKGISLNTLIKEIEKCVVRCANCHRRRHAK